MPAHPTIAPGERNSTRSVPATELIVGGMTCGNCARHVTEALQSVEGVNSATVNLEEGKASVRWMPGVAENSSDLVQAVKKAGYEARPISKEEHDHGEKKLAGWHLTLWIGLLGTALLMLGEWVFQLSDKHWFRWGSFFVAAIVQIFAGAPFYRGAWNQLKNKSANMDTLVALGSTTAFAYSAWALITGAHGHLYFMEAAAIIALISTGHWLEARVSSRASSTLRQLLHLAPETALKQVNNGIEIEVPLAELKPGDLIVLKPGDRVPTDGMVIEGNSAVDESMLTGESAPIDKHTGSLLYGGTVNLNGRMLMRVTATGDDTALAQIIAAVQRAQSSRARIQRLGDRVASIFVPVVVSIALAAGLWWAWAPESAFRVHSWLAQFLWPAHLPRGAMAAAFIIPAAVLIIACPCAMGLATPVAIMAGSNAAAERGILIRDGVALEKAGEITAVLFDKTGTLTVGKPEAEVVSNGASDTKGLAAALARHSNHPISQAVAKLGDDQFDFVNWREIPGRGVEAVWQAPDHSSQTVRLGSLAWLRELGVSLEASAPLISRYSTGGSSLVGLAIDNSCRGLIAIRDTVKPYSEKVVRQLQQQGLKVYLVTGDNSFTAEDIARNLGIDSANVFAEVPPDQKATLVKKLQQQGERVAFVGDGINDAPALEQADLGIAVSRASDIAREAADIVLLKSEIEAVPESLSLARATLRTIKQNLFWAFFYNAVGIPLAALGFMSPILCAAAMGLSDLVVIGNALRLKNWRR